MRICNICGFEKRGVLCSQNVRCSEKVKLTILDKDGNLAYIELSSFDTFTSVFLQFDRYSSLQREANNAAH